MRHFGRTDGDSTAQDFGINLEGRMLVFLKATDKDLGVASVLRLWSRVHDELHQSRSLPAHFALALTELVIRDGRTQSEIARAAGIHISSLSNYMKGDQIPSKLEPVAKLEEVLGVLPGTLISKLPTATLRRAANIPLAWWPKLWQGSGNARYQRDKVIELIPTPTLIGPLEELEPVFLEALQKVHDGKVEPAFQRKIRDLRVKVYGLRARNWPDRLRAEFSALRTYKTAPSGWGNKDLIWKWGDITADAAQTRLGSFFGFLCLPADHPDPELRGLGMRPEDLTLAWLAVKEVVGEYLDFRCRRSGGHSHGMEVSITMWGALLKPKSGWLWLHSELLARLPERQRQDVDAGGGWEDYCANTRLELLDFLKALRRSDQIKPMRDPMLPIRRILDHPQPLSLIHNALTLHRSYLEVKGQVNGRHSWTLATEWRDHLLISILARFPLRAKQWGLLTYREDGSGYLQYHHQDSWRLVIPYEDFKNSQNKAIFPLHGQESVVVLKFSDSEALQQLIPLLEFYLEKVRPIIANQGDFLFPTKNGECMSPVLLYSQIKMWTWKYLSQSSPRRLGIEGVRPFGPHAFRDIVATHIIKTTGSIALAANILLDSEEVVRKHYARFLPEDRVGLALKGMASAFKPEEDKE